MTGWILGVLLLITLVVSPVAWRRLPNYRDLFPITLSTLVGCIALPLVYVTSFDQGACSSKTDVVCVLNANQGVLGLLAVGIAVFALWANAISDRLKSTAATRAAKSRAMNHLRATIAETKHNLIHCALETPADGNFRSTPQLSFRATDDLMNGPSRHTLSPAAEECIANLYRNVAKINSANERLSKLLPPHAGFADALREHQAGMEGLINHCVRLLLECLRNPDLTDFVLSDGYREFKEIGKHIKASGGDDGEAHGVYVTYRTSESGKVASSLRLRGAPIVCWVEDAHVEGVNIHCMSRLFRDVSHVH